MGERFDIISLLTPPSVCQAYAALPMGDKRKGAIWFCPHARKNIGKGRKCPPCLCRAALSSAALSDTGETGK